MQFDKAKKLEEAWGNKPCTHPSLQKEYYLSHQTGDYICTQCGRTITPQEKEKIEERRRLDAGNQQNPISVW